MKYCALVDCDNFFVSCERLFQPALEKKAVIVLSNNDGCVVSRSQEAKQMGIEMGTPFFKISSLCSLKNVAVYSSNFQLYRDLSDRVMSLLLADTYECEIYSIDEAFIWFSDIDSTNHIIQHCEDLHRRIRRWIGIPTSIGLAPTKTLAKIATSLAKTSRSLANNERKAITALLIPSQWLPILKKTPIKSVWGIGSALERTFHGLGIQTAYDLHESDPTTIRRKAGVVGERLLLELRGVPCFSAKAPDKRKSVTCSRSFGRPVTSFRELTEAISTHISSACETLRREGLCAGSMHIYALSAINHDTGIRDCHGITIPFIVPTNITPQAISKATHQIPRCMKEGISYTKCGVVMLNLVPETRATLDFFEEQPSERQRTATQVVDAINTRFGKNTIFYGATGIHPQWAMKCDHRSSRYTTNWDEIAIVRA